MSQMENIADIFTPEGKKKLRKRQLLVFNKGGKNTSYRIVSLVGGVWVREVQTMTGDELNAHSGHQIDSTRIAQAKHGGVWCEDCKTVIG